VGSTGFLQDIDTQIQGDFERVLENQNNTFQGTVNIVPVGILFPLKKFR